MPEPSVSLRPHRVILDDPLTYVVAMMRALVAAGVEPPLSAAPVDLECAMHAAGMVAEQEFLWHVFMTRSAEGLYFSRLARDAIDVHLRSGTTRDSSP